LRKCRTFAITETGLDIMDAVASAGLSRAERIRGDSGLAMQSHHVYGFGGRVPRIFSVFSQPRSGQEAFFTLQLLSFCLG
jgi:hypothetical protein